MTTEAMNTSKNEIRSTFSAKDPWLGNKDEMPNFLAYIPKYLAKSVDTRACSEILIKIYEEQIDLFDQIPPQEENPAVPAVAARGGNNPRAAVAEIPPSGCAMDKRRWYSEEEREQAGGPFDVHAKIWFGYCEKMISSITSPLDLTSVNTKKSAEFYTHGYQVRLVVGLKKLLFLATVSRWISRMSELS